MGLNIKNPETCRLAAELAELTGDTMTGAITKALRESLDRRRTVQEQDEEAREKKVAEIVARVAELVRASGDSGGMSSQDVDRLLYDERGLPD